MKILSVVGARPQFVKLAPIARECAHREVEHIIVHTGQHYDPMLSDVFFADLNIPDPQVHLGVGSSSHGRQTGAMLAAMDEVLETHRPDWVLVYGDTNSTLAATLSAVKMHIPIAHLEAGLRSFNRRMPEEHNRVLSDHAADLCLTPTDTGARHLAAEGLAARTVVVGDVMTDVLNLVHDQIDGQRVALHDEESLAPGGYHLATIHRAESTDDPDRLRAIIDSLRDLGRLDRPVVLLAHPRTIGKASEAGINLEVGVSTAADGLVVRTPLAYPDLIAAADAARSVVTDSGGLQKEAFLLRTPCTTVRTETEWTETIDLGWNVLVEPGPELITAAMRSAPPPTDASPYGDGRAAARTLDALGA